MESATEFCLRCGNRNQSWLHGCLSRSIVIDPELNRLERRKSNPLERLTVAEWAQIFQEDEYGLHAEAEQQMAQFHLEYLQNPLIYRCEFHNITRLEYQGTIDIWSIVSKGSTEEDLQDVLDFINESPSSCIFLEIQHEYLCKLISLDKHGGKYVWRIKKLSYENEWRLMEF